VKWGDLVIVSAPGMTAVSVVIQSDWLEATDSVLVAPKGWNNFSNQFPYHEQHNYQHIGQTGANGRRRFALDGFALYNVTR
jgi:hypothetical protein